MVSDLIAKRTNTCKFNKSFDFLGEILLKVYTTISHSAFTNAVYSVAYPSGPYMAFLSKKIMF
ncbi:hypothetical protein ES711_06455 [Gelidibacter salicanalis]|uniref:Uncharacterized protein n=1 Tax=Gelidibacter salicanalis TaxID=291193 RepID=A0A5C7AI97_9FLAO|nr:hypothetical protein [Gelidibacter salicanalis]TXE08151.1 hypothetical protein ES711_06455 [Gelidibacter salicanalis]